MFKTSKEDTRLEKMIEELENYILSEDVESDNYTKMVDQLGTLYKYRQDNAEKKTELKDWIPVIGTVGGILLIVTFEAFGHTITSKSLSIATKIKN